MIDKDFVVHGPKLNEPIPEGSYGLTIYRCLQENYNLPIAMIDAITRKNVSIKTIFEQSSRLAHSLQRSGVRQNDVIAVSAENCLNFPIPVLAGLWVGATVTFFNPAYITREVIHVANISKPTVIFCTKESVHQISAAANELKFVKKIIGIDGISSENKVESMDSFITKNCRDYTKFEPVNVDSQNVAIILYSSGTTGLPKGVMLTHYNLNANYTLFRDPRFSIQRVPGTTLVLGLLPFFHTYGLAVLILNLMMGRMVLVLSKFEPHSFLKTVQDFKLKYLSIVPSIANFLAQSKLVDMYDLSHLEYISSGAAPITNKHTEELLLKRFKNVPRLSEGYGLTEATVAAIVTPLNQASKPGSAGKLLPETAAKVVDVQTGKRLGPGESGELHFKGPQIMKGYAGDPISTNQVLDKDGWLATGDIGYYDEDEFFYIVDRVKELIKYKGFQVAPVELESLILQNQAVADVSVIGIPDDTAGEVPLAFVVKSPGQNITENDIIQFVAERVSPSKFLRGGVRFIEEIPRNAAGKIQRHYLKQLVTQKSKL